MVWGIVYNVVLLTCCLYAWLCGGRPERLGVLLLIGGSYATWLIKIAFGSSYYTGFMAPVFIFDCFILFLLILLAIKANRYWPLWAAGFHLADLLTHIAVFANAGTAPMAYAHSVAFWGYAVTASLAFGTWFEVQRRRPKAAIDLE